MSVTPPYLDPTCQEALYEVDGGAYDASYGLSELNTSLSEAGEKRLHRDAEMIQIKCVYSERSAHDGVRILVDRGWHGGLSEH